MGVLLSQVSHGETLENSANSKTQNYSSQGVRELSFSNPHIPQSLVKGYPQGSINPRCLLAQAQQAPTAQGQPSHIDARQAIGGQACGAGEE